MPRLLSSLRALAAGLTLGAVALTTPALAAPLQVTVRVENLAATNSISFAPLHVGFHSGLYDAFNIGQVATAGIVSVAEGGAGGAWQAAFAAADPTATRGTVGGLLLPGGTASRTFVVDPLLNPFFNFGAMAVPSNDYFIGNDSPTQFRLFDAAGQLVVNSIDQQASALWDAGSEAFDPAAAAFVGNNDLRTPQNGVVGFDFLELNRFDGLTTGAGHVFRSGLSADSPIYRISFEASQVPEPASFALVGLAMLGMRVTRRRPRGAGDGAALVQ